MHASNPSPLKNRHEPAASELIARIVIVLAIIEKDNVLAVVADEEAHWTAVPGEGFELRRIVLKRGNVWIVPIAYRFRKRGRRFSPSQLGEIYSPPSGSMHE
jgi:hypothetical protein